MSNALGQKQTVHLAMVYVTQAGRPSRADDFLPRHAPPQREIPDATVRSHLAVDQWMSACLLPTCTTFSMETQ